MEKLLITIPGEDAPRVLEVRLLEPDEEEVGRGMNAEEIASIFREEEVGDAEQGEDDADQESCGEEDAALLEGQNILHDLPREQGDGEDGNEEVVAFGFPDEEDALVQHGAEIPEIPEDAVVGEDPTLLDPDLFDDDVPLMYEAPFPSNPKYVPVVDDDAPLNPHACSSKGTGGTHGLYVTPSEVRARLPAGKGAKVQHRRAKVWNQSSGWQAWGSSYTGSRFFSYGPGGRFPDSQSAMEAALNFCWAEHARLDSA